MLIERTDYLNLMMDLFEKSQSGQGQVLLISGEAGIGKSSIVGAFKQQVHTQDSELIWAAGGSEALFTPRTLGPIRDMAAKLGSDVETLTNSDAERSELYAALIQALSTNQPTIMVCEDLHWADNATLDLLKYVSRRLGILPVLLVMTYRDNEVDAAHSLTQLLGDLPSGHTHRIQLQPLSKNAVKALALEYDVTLQDDSVHAITNGNPFYVTELLASRATSDSVPASVRDAVSLRLGQLSDGARNLLETISVIPNAISYAFLERLIGPDAIDIAGECIAKGILVDDGFRIKFRHELSRLATLERLPPGKRRQCHGNCLDLLLEKHAASQIDQIVHHASGAFRGDLVLEYAPKAAAIAALAGAHREAAAHYASALRFVDDAEPEFAATLYENWAYEAALYNRTDNEVIDARRHALTLWRALSRAEKVGENLRHISRLHWYRGESADAQYFADQAVRVLESLPESAERAMAYSLRSQLHMLNDQMEDAIKWGELALQQKEVENNPDVRAHALNNIGTALAFRGDAEGVARLNESLSLSLSYDLHENAARAYNNLAEYAVEFYDFELAEQTLLNGIAYDSENDLDAWTYYLSGRLAQLRLEQGRIDDAIVVANGVLSVDRLSLLTKLPAKIVLARALMRKSDPSADAMMTEALEDALATDELQNIVPAKLTIIESAWLRRNFKLGQHHLETLLRLNEGDRHPWNIGAMKIWAMRFGLEHDSIDVDGLPEPYVLEVSGRYEDAASAWLHIGANYAAQLSRIAANTPGELESAMNALRDIGAAEALKRAAHSAETLGMPASAIGKSRGSSKATKSHPLGLTSKEQIVLQYLVAGKTNKEIADEMSRSARTIEHHVSSILGKLNAANRMAAVLRVQNEPWLLSAASK